MGAFFNLHHSFNYVLIGINSIGITGNFFFSYLVFKKLNHSFIAGILIILQSIAYWLIRILSEFSKKGVIKYLFIVFIGALNGISNGGFNPVFDSLVINYLEVNNKMERLNLYRRVISVGNLITGQFINLTNKFIEDKYLTPMITSGLFAIIASIILFMVRYKYQLSKTHFTAENRNLKETVKNFLHLNFLFFYLLTVFNGFSKLYFTMLQRFHNKAMNFQDEDMNHIKSIGCVAEILFSFIFEYIEKIISFRFLYPFSVSLNLLKFFYFGYVDMSHWNYKPKMAVMGSIECLDKIIYYMTIITANRILVDICSIKYLTIAQGIRYASFIGLGGLTASLLGFFSETADVQDLSSEDFMKIFKQTNFINIFTFGLSIILYFILTFKSISARQKER